MFSFFFDDYRLQNYDNNSLELLAAYGKCVLFKWLIFRWLFENINDGVWNNYERGMERKLQTSKFILRSLQLTLRSLQFVLQSLQYKITYFTSTLRPLTMFNPFCRVLMRWP
jgi:hypothetical protein